MGCGASAKQHAAQSEAQDVSVTKKPDPDMDGEELKNLCEALHEKGRLSELQGYLAEFSPNSSQENIGTLPDGRISNDTPITPPKKETLLDNTQLFLPETAVRTLKLEANMDYKGDVNKELWFGRNWELRALLAAQGAQQKRFTEKPLSEERKAELDKICQHPSTRARLTKVAARMRGAVLRLRCSLSILDKLKYANLKGTLVYAHGSGGNSWDNMRICRKICKLGFIVIVPDGFAYPKDTPMGKLRHKDVRPLHKSSDDVDYWAGDLIYSSGASGELVYSTKAEGVLAHPEDFRKMYEKCYQLRRCEFHFVLQRLPQFIRLQGIFTGGTSEGAMTIARFDDQRYGPMILGRFINSFSIEYCYFTPTPEDGRLGGSLEVPTLNIIGTKDQYFGPHDSVTKIVASDHTTGYGDKVIDGNGYPCMVEQNLRTGLVCILEDGVHSPCNTHDNFLLPLFDFFLRRPNQIWHIDNEWGTDAVLRNLLKVTACHITPGSKVLKLFCPIMKVPQKVSFRRMEEITVRNAQKQKEEIELMKNQDAQNFVEQKENQSMLDEFRKQCAAAGGRGFDTGQVDPKTYYAKDAYTKSQLKSDEGSGVSQLTESTDEGEQVKS